MMDAFSENLFATTVDYFRSPAFAKRAKRIMKRPSPGKLGDAGRIFSQVLRAAMHEKYILLGSTWGRIHPELLAAAVIGLWPQQLRPKIILLGCMWEPNQGIRNWIERVILKLADRSIARYIVQSTEELTIFPQNWGVSANKLRFCPFYFTVKENDLPKAPLSLDGTAGYQDLQNGYVFAGGNSMRDYAPLVEAARQLPDLQFVFATNLLSGYTDLPANVCTQQVSHLEFIRLMFYSAVNVVPIRAGLHRAAGQQTYLNAMYMGRPTIIADSFAVKDHVRNWETGIIVDGTSDSYVHAIEWVFNPANIDAVERLRIAGRDDVIQHFSFECHVQRVLDIIGEVEGS